VWMLGGVATILVVSIVASLLYSKPSRADKGT